MSRERPALVRLWLGLALLLVAWLGIAAGVPEVDAAVGDAPVAQQDDDDVVVGPLDADVDEDDELAAGSGPDGSQVALVVGVLVVLVALGAPLFLIIGVIASLCFLLWGEGYDAWAPCATLDADTVCGYDTLPAKMAGLTSKNVLLAIPFFVVSGAIMSAGDIANRLVTFARALVGFLPGGLAIATVGGCVFFAAISGSSPVTVIAIGSVMFPALMKAGYSERFGLGLVTTAGSLGIVIPPSIPMLVFAIVAGGTTPLDVGELFLSGVLPGLMIGAMLAMYSMYVAIRDKTSERARFSLREVWTSFRDGLWAILLPVQILGGIYSGLFTPTEAAAISVVYSLVVELFIHRHLRLAQLPKLLAESAVMMGSLLVIMALAFGLNDFLVEEKIPDHAVALIRRMDLDAVEFLLVVNGLLLIAGALMDSISAIMIIAPLIAPVAMKVGIDPVHLGIIFIVNLEIGYLTPPIGLNLFVASSVFERPLGTIIRAVVPFIAVMLVGLTIVTYVPSVALGPVNVMLRDKPFYEPFPADAAEREAARATAAARPDAPKILAPGEGKGEKKVRSMQDMTATTELFTACDYADEVTAKPAGTRAAAWLEGLEDEGVADPRVLAMAEAAVAAAGTPKAFTELRAKAEALLEGPWQCPALEPILAEPPSATKKPVADDDED